MAVDISKMEGTTKKELHVFYVLDTSGSMMGAPIGALNDAMRNTVKELSKKDGEKADLRIAVLEFNSITNWITQGNDGVEHLSDFVWTDLSAGGYTALGAALKELNTSLSRNAKMKAQTGNKVPVIIFMSDGYPNDDWEEGLRELSQNKWYRHAIKIAFALGDDADCDLLAKVIGVTKDGKIMPAYEAVIKTNDLQIFSNMIRVVSVSASLAASTSQMVGTDASGAGVVKSVLPSDFVAEENTPVILETPVDNSADTIYSDSSDAITDDIFEDFDVI